MEFCEQCDNKMNIKWKKNPLNNDKLLIYYCLSCGNTKEYDKHTIVNPKLYQQNYIVDKSFITLNNELLCEDPTLQKVSNPDIKCPNCTDVKQDIVFYIYDITNMKYLYICCHCKSSWKTE